MPDKCWENNWSNVPCNRPAVITMEDATKSGAADIVLCEFHARKYEEQGAPWKRKTLTI